MLGRAAQGVYWMSRYLERAENTARLLNVGLRIALTAGRRCDAGGRMAFGARHHRSGPCDRAAL
jgi:uncharacterized alpha-E superfamily protein